jgi:hypothetical protein
VAEVGRPQDGTGMAFELSDGAADAHHWPQRRNEELATRVYSVLPVGLVCAK